MDTLKTINQKGYVQVYTGNGKGKTTAALGLAFRAMGRGMRSYIAQFMKGTLYGELKAAEQMIPWITIEQFGRDMRDCMSPQYDDTDRSLARKGLIKAEKEINSGVYQIVILDEINVACYYNLITVTDILSIIQNKPHSVELILTGIYASDDVIKAAYLVSEIIDIKHYFQKDIIARDGIER